MKLSLLLRWLFWDTITPEIDICSSFICALILCNLPSTSFVFLYRGQCRNTSGSLNMWWTRDAAITLANGCHLSVFFSFPFAKLATPLITAHSMPRSYAASYRPIFYKNKNLLIICKSQRDRKLSLTISWFSNKR